MGSAHYFNGLETIMKQHTKVPNPHPNTAARAPDDKSSALSSSGPSDMGCDRVTSWLALLMDRPGRLGYSPLFSGSSAFILSTRDVLALALGPADSRDCSSRPEAGGHGTGSLRGRSRESCDEIEVPTSVIRRSKPWLVVVVTTDCVHVPTYRATELGMACCIHALCTPNSVRATIGRRQRVEGLWGFP